MRLEELPNLAAIQKAAQQYQHTQKALVDLCVAVQQIPAPTGGEAARAARVENMFRQLELADVGQDEIHNVYARIPGQRSSPALLISAHTDTVFPPETDLSVRWDEENGHIAGPGIGDNSAGVAGLVALAESLTALPTPPVDIWLVANSNEEGLGDLKGMRAVIERLKPVLGAVLVIEGMGLGRLVHQALGVRRYRIRTTAPGGHSWGDFGTASAVHALVSLAAELARLQTPTKPRTTYNIGRIGGGTSVNTIAQEAWLELDLRSAAPETLSWIDQKVQRIVAQHRRSHAKFQSGVHVSMELIGQRPAGAIPADHPLVQAASHILAVVEVAQRPDIRISSTDANIPLSRGIPALCIGLTHGGDAHRPSEWIDPQPLTKGMQQLLYLTWWTAVWLTGRGVGDWVTG